jgi:Ca2+-binding EF-hand superfamily protein
LEENKPSNDEINQRDAELTKFALSLFKLWDHKNFGKLKVKVLVENFIALGFAANEETALTFFRSMVTSPDGSFLKTK